MNSAITRSLSAAVAAALLLALAPSAAFAAYPRPARRPSAALSMPAHPIDESWARDAYDQHSEDDTAGGARDLTAHASWNAANGYGRAAYEEAHTFYVASNESTAGEGDAHGDQDWFSFDVSAENLTTCFTIEAQAGFAWIDPVIEVYGPTSAATITPTDPAASVDASGHGVPDTAAVASSDNGKWTVLGYSSSVTFVPPAEGRYFVRVRPYFDTVDAFLTPGVRAGYAAWDTGAGPYTLRLKAGTVTRLAGGSRIQTAIMVSRERYADGDLPRYDGMGTVVLANGYNFPDALAGSTLAGAVGGPLLLTHPTYLDNDVRDEIVRLGAHRVFILGGTPAVSDAVKNKLAAIPGIGGPNVIRVAGKPGTGRVQTAVAVAKKANEEFGVAKTAFVANGFAFPDALAASPMAAFNVAPILLTHPGYLDGDTLSAFDALGTTDVVILGSTSAVGQKVEDRLVQRFGRGHVLRLGGKDRYETAEKIAVWETGDRGVLPQAGCAETAEASKLDALDWRHFAIAAGWNYPDALGGGAFAGLAGYPILLNPAGDNVSPRILDIQGNALPPGSSLLSLDPGPGYVYEAGRSYVLGSSSVVGDGVVESLDPLLAGPSAGD